ncbi:MAG TPA: hypothetical protein VD813_07820 [Pseudonocardia sp.]|nr:hypothetical protein [Pseudonocardia sp.]
MGAVPEVEVSASALPFPSGWSPVPLPERRYVAVAVSATELLRPGSDLARLIEGTRSVDLLLACEDTAPHRRPGLAEVSPLRSVDRTAREARHDGPEGGAAGDRGTRGGAEVDTPGRDDDEGFDAADGDDGEHGDDGEARELRVQELRAAELRAEVARLGHPALHLHRLGLHRPLPPSTEADLVAALSELVGFDPEPGVYLLAPTAGAGDASRAVVDRVAQRIARAYGLPLLRYRSLELSLVGESS